MNSTDWEDIIHEGVAKDGRRFHIRHLHWSDLEQLMDFYNSLIEAKADIARIVKVSHEEEEAWLKNALDQEEKDLSRHYPAEMNHKIIGHGGLTRGRSDWGQTHLATLGIAIGPGYWDQGIGTTLMKVMIEDAKRWGLTMLLLDVFATNERARHVYEKLGFRKIGHIPKAFLRNEKYIDEIRMILEL